MGIRLCFLVVLAACGIIAQISGYYVRQEAGDMRALVDKIQADTVTLETMRTREQVLRSFSQVERWAEALSDLAPPTPQQIQPSLDHALAPRAMPRPAAMPHADAMPVAILPDQPAKGVSL